MSKSSTISPLAILALALSVAGCDKQESPAATEPAVMGGTATEPHPLPAPPAADVDLSGIARAEGGKTVAEVFAEREQLAGQTVVFRGKVVKTNAGIMGKDWLHVRDGTGQEGTNDLTVTTAPGSLPSVGDTVLVTGPVALNKDFGMGYQYDILIEDATVQVESGATP